MRRPRHEVFDETDERVRLFSPSADVGVDDLSLVLYREMRLLSARRTQADLRARALANFGKKFFKLGFAFPVYNEADPFVRIIFPLL